MCGEEKSTMHPMECVVMERVATPGRCDADLGGYLSKYEERNRRIAAAGGSLVDESEPHEWRGFEGNRMNTKSVHNQGLTQEEATLWHELMG